jgi:hypothetical protein
MRNVVKLRELMTVTNSGIVTFDDLIVNDRIADAEVGQSCVYVDEYRIVPD